MRTVLRSEADLVVDSSSRTYVQYVRVRLLCKFTIHMVVCEEEEEEEEDFLCIIYVNDDDDDDTSF